MKKTTIKHIVVNHNKKYVVFKSNASVEELLISLIFLLNDLCVSEGSKVYELGKERQTGLFVLHIHKQKPFKMFLLKIKKNKIYTKEKQTDAMSKIFKELRIPFVIKHKREKIPGETYKS